MSARPGSIPKAEKIPDQCGRSKMPFHQYREHIRVCSNRYCVQVLENYEEIATAVLRRKYYDDTRRDF